MSRSPFNTKPPTPPPASEPGASKNSANYLRDLMLDKALCQGTDETEARAKIEAWFDKQWPAQKRVSFDIDRLKAEGYNGSKFKRQNAETASALEKVDIEDGFYQLPDGRVIKILHAIHGSGYQYGKVFLPENVGNPDESNWGKIVGAPNLVRRGAVRIDTDEAKAAELGKLYGVCMVCGTTLTDDTVGGSIERGIGPVCLSKRGW